MGYDKRSFVMGMIVAFSECVAGGCKRLALSPPLLPGEYEQWGAEACAIIERHGLVHERERNADMPEAARWEWILIAARQETLDAYHALRREGFSPARSLAPFSGLLSYNPAEGAATGYDAFRAFFPMPCGLRPKGEHFLPSGARMG